MTLSEIRKKIMDEMPPEWRFRPEDGKAITKHKDLLLSLTDELVQGFYDTLYAHPATKSVFRDGERPDREQTLRDWWIKTVEGPHDDRFWDWMTYVGLLHVKRKVKNNMMLAAWGYVINLSRNRILEQLSPEEARGLLEALVRLGKTVQALIAEGYLEIYLKSVQEGSGMSAQLMDQLVKVELDRIEQEMKGGK